MLKLDVMSFEEIKKEYNLKEKEVKDFNFPFYEMKLGVFYLSERKGIPTGVFRYGKDELTICRKIL